MKWVRCFFSDDESTPEPDNITHPGKNDKDNANRHDNDSQKVNDAKDPFEDVQLYGFDLYPERRGEYAGPSWTKKLLVGEGIKDERNKRLCEVRVVEAFTSNPLVKLLTGALEKAGCPVSLSRNFACEVCSPRVTGGYDQELNQIVICQDIKKKLVPGVMIHELIHMYDYCVNKLNFKDMDHLACTEIRAANLTHCSFISSMLLGESSIFNIKESHQYCVKRKAAQSVMVTRNVDEDTALKAVTKVFDKCYNDLEPIGRRIRRNSVEDEMAYDEAVHYKICDPS